MKKIYEGAKTVLVCMGKDCDGGAEHVAALIKEHVDTMPNQSSIADLPILSKGDKILNDPRWKYMKALMSSTWFSRVWVLQEVGVAKFPLVLYGDVEFSYRKLMTLSRWIVRCAPSLQSEAGIDVLTIHSDWEDWSADWHPEHDYTLLDFLSHAKGLGCKEAHDHIYAFLGHPLAQREDGKTPILMPDYEKPVKVLYKELSEWMLDAPRIGLGVLAAVEHDERSINEDTKTWVARWNTDIIWNSMGYYPDFCYRASGNEEPPRLATPIYNVLYVQAFCLDVVDITYQFSAMEGEWETSNAITFLQPMRTLHDTLDRIWSDVSREGAPCKYAPKDRLDALSLTLCAGLTNYLCAEKTVHQHRANFIAFWNLRQRLLLRPAVPLQQGEDMSEEGNANRFLSDMQLSCKGRSFFITKEGYYGLGPWITKPGDECFILKGARVPFVLRRQGAEPSRKLVGETYVHGIMHGELLQVPDGRYKWADLSLV